MNQLLYNKYCKNPSMLTFNEILDDFRQIKPTFNPILDICIIKTLGKYITNVTNFQKWMLCPNLIEEISMFRDEDYNIKNQDIIDIITRAKNKYKQPLYTINEVSRFVSDNLKNSITDVLKYFEMKTTYNNFLDKIKLKYQDSWDDIEKQYDSISDIMFENFSELENDSNFEKTIELIESINDEASQQVEQLINVNNTLEDFNKQMDYIYEKVIKSKNLDKYHDVMLDMFGVEKEIHRMSRSILLCTVLLETNF